MLAQLLHIPIGNIRLCFKFAWLQLIDKAPNPGLARLNRAYQRMPNMLKMLGGMFVFR